MCSLYQLIYSYRDNKNSSFPELISQNSINALNMMKDIRNTLSSSKILILFYFKYIYKIIPNIK